MRSLSELQERFSQHLRQDPPSALGALSGAISSGIPADVSLTIYRNNVHSRFQDALADVFPAVRRIVGDDFFRATVRSYMAAHPCRTGTLIGIGREFAAFLCTFEPAHELPYLPEVASLEWLHREAYHAADAVPVDMTALHALATAQTDAAELRLHPSVRMLRTRYPILGVWLANRGDDEMAPIVLSGPGQHLLIARPSSDVTVLEITRETFGLLSEFEGGSALAAATAAQAGESPTLLNELAGLMAAGIFTLSHQETGS